MSNALERLRTLSSDNADTSDTWEESSAESRTAAVLRTLHGASLTLTLNATGDGLTAAPRSAITPALGTLIREHRGGLIAHLRSRDWNEPAANADSARVLGMGAQWYALQPEEAWAAWTAQQEALQAAWDAKDTVGYQRAIAAFEALYAAWAGSVWPSVDDRASRAIVLGVPAGQGALVVVGGQGVMG